MSSFRSLAALAVIAVAVATLALTVPYTRGASGQEGDAACNLSDLVLLNSGTPLEVPPTGEAPAVQTTPELISFPPTIADVSFNEETCLFLQQTLMALSTIGPIAPAASGAAGDFENGCSMVDVVTDFITAAPESAPAIIADVPSVGLSEEACSSVWLALTLVASGDLTPLQVPIEALDPELINGAVPPEAVPGMTDEMEEPDATEDACVPEDTEATGDTEATEDTEASEDTEATEDTCVPEDTEATEDTDVTEETEVTDGSEETAESSMAVEEGDEEAGSMSTETGDEESEIIVEEIEPTTVE